jgi:hypothetical protein
MSQKLQPTNEQQNQSQKQPRVEKKQNTREKELDNDGKFKK